MISWDHKPLVCMPGNISHWQEPDKRDTKASLWALPEGRSLSVMYENSF